MERHRIPGTDLAIYVDANERRGKAILDRGLIDRRIVKVWRTIALRFMPDLVLDVGVNYGEVLFSSAYPAHARIFGIEANANLGDCLSRSAEAHPNGKQIKMIYALASDRDEPETRFYVNSNWSGTSAAIPHFPSSVMEERKVPGVKVDTLLSPFSAGKKVLFKIDVEGHEGLVLQGMRKTIKQAEESIGLIEFDSDYLKLAGTDPDLFLTFLNRFFHVFHAASGDRAVDLSALDFSGYKKYFGKKSIHADLLLLSRKDRIQSLGFAHL